jgi:hypothetical protein
MFALMCTRSARDTDIVTLSVPHFLSRTSESWLPEKLTSTSSSSSSAVAVAAVQAVK